MRRAHTAALIALAPLFLGCTQIGDRHSQVLTPTPTPSPKVVVKPQKPTKPPRFFGPPGSTPDFTGFTSVGTLDLDLFYFWELQDSSVATVIGYSPLCDFDPLAVAPLRYFTWDDVLQGSRAATEVAGECTLERPPGEPWRCVPGPGWQPPPQAALQARINAAKARNDLIAELFPQWEELADYATSLVHGTDAWLYLPHRYDADDLNHDEPHGTLNQAVYLAMGKRLPDGRLINAGAYDPRVHGRNTNGYYPVALCSLILRPQLY